MRLSPSGSAAFSIGILLAGVHGMQARAEVIYYRITPLGAAIGTENCMAWDINNDGDVVGICEEVDTPAVMAFIWKAGTGMLAVPTSEAVPYFKEAFAINNIGDVAGMGDSPLQGHVAVIYDHATTTKRLGSISPYPHSRAYDLNDNSPPLVVGEAAWTSGGSAAFVAQSQAGTWGMTNLGVLIEPTIPFAGASGVNENQHIAGWALIDSNEDDFHDLVRAFVWRPNGSSWAPYPLLPSSDPSNPTAALDINDAGVIVGTEGTQLPTPVMWLPDGQGGYEDAVPLDDVFGEAYAVNSMGLIVGNVFSPDTYGFLWHCGTLYDLRTMVPETGSTTVGGAVAINDYGVIAAAGSHNGIAQPLLLSPTSLLCSVEDFLPESFQGCFADVDGNGVVNAADSGAVSANIGGTAPGIVCVFDLDGNGFVNAGDRGQVLANIGSCEELPDFQNGSGFNHGTLDNRFPPLLACD